MKSSSEGVVARPRQGGGGAAAAAAALAPAAAAPRKARGAPENPVAVVKVLPGRKRAQPAPVADQLSAAFEGSQVRAHDVVMKGVSGRALTRLWESTLGVLPTEAVLKAIGVSARTAHRIKSDPDKPLDSRTTDGIYRLESVLAMAQEVLGSAQAAHEWLDTEAMGLEFRKPIDLLSTSPGADAVKTLLQRMKYGVYA